MPQANPHYDTTLTSEYISAVKRPAEVVHDFRDSSCGGVWTEKGEACLAKKIIFPGKGSETEGPPPIMAFVIANVLTPAECDDLIDQAEDFGIRDGPKHTARTARRTQNYTNDALSEKVEKRIGHILESEFQQEAIFQEEAKENRSDDFNLIGEGGDHQDKTSRNKCTYRKNAYMGPFYGVHTNWRILRYDAGDGSAFPAHFDQMDSLQIRRTDGRKDLVVSSHTFLMQLSDHRLEGGATRFYPKAKANRPKDNRSQEEMNNFRKQQFDHAIDVVLPRGWALVFRQRGLLHAGQPIVASSPCSKYVAQAGILRLLPEGTLLKPSVFKNGPGVTNGAF